MEQEMFILGICGKPFDLFEINNELKLDFTESIKESEDKETLEYKNVFYIIDSNKLDEIVSRMDTFYHKLIANKRNVNKRSLFEYKLNKTIFYVVDVTRESELTNFTLSKIKELQEWEK